MFENVDQLNFVEKLLYGQVPKIKNEVLNVEKNCIIGLPNKRSIPKCVIFMMQIRNKGRKIYWYKVHERGEN
ncbi:hypothetical protein H5410_037670 [Solanum commersonii]|uniref:Uncharacterized protein n=1 Tax=Solanum commersonii TaxID=4109 RepID=A0A9J5YBT8_SOLCO|nr:hypothetical protein H5410_037670 [Solanum commersonii]